MKKWLVALLTAALMLTGLAVAEPAAATVVENRIENGGYVIRIPVQGDGTGWVADDMSQDPSVVKLESAAVEDGAFVARYAPVADGEMTISIRHYSGIACDAAFTWDLRVAGGQVVECTGGSLTESPAAEDMAPYITGEWVEKELGNDSLFIERGDVGFTVQYLAPGRDGATEFVANASYDCVLDAFVYADGTFRSAAITDSEDVGEGELIAENTNGSFEVVPGDEADPIMVTWYNSLSPENTLTFVRAKAETEPRIVAPMSETVDLNDGAYSVAFNRDDLKDGTLDHVHIYTMDQYDIADIAALEVGDSIIIDGKTVEITDLNRSEGGWLEINGGLLEGGYDLSLMEEDNCYRVRLDDDYPTYTDHGEVTMTLDENVTFNDTWSLERDPVIVTGIPEVEKAIRESENEHFFEDNTTIRLEGGKVVEIIRTYVP